MNKVSAAPFNVRDAAANELAVPIMAKQLLARDAALSEIEHIAAEACGQPAGTKEARAVCGLLHAAESERREVGYLPEDTVEEAVARGSAVARRHSFAEREAARGEKRKAQR